MPTVIQIKRRPSGVETFGQSMQDLSNNFIQHMLGMTQQQNSQNMQMLGLGMQERRMADANARQDKQIAATEAYRKLEMDQRERFHKDSLAMQKASADRAFTATNKPTLVEYEDEHGVKRKGWSTPGSPNVTPISFGSAPGRTGGGMPGLDAAVSEATSEVLDPNWSPVSPVSPISPGARKGLEILYPHLAEGADNNSAQPEAQAPALTASHAKDPLTRAFQLLGIEFPQGGQQQNDPAPSTPTPTPRNLTVAERGFDAMGVTFPNVQELATGTIYTPSGEVYTPKGGEQIPFQGKQEKRVMGGREYFGRSTPNGRLFILDSPAPSKAENRPLPANVITSISETQGQLAQVRGAMDALNSDPNATGAKSVIPDFALNRIDKKGIDARAAIGNLSSLVIRDRSGAAVTAAEFPRLRPFLPSLYDDYETIKKKLASFYKVIQEENQIYLQSLSDSGYTVPTSLYNNAKQPFQQKHSDSGGSDQWEDM